MTPGLNENQNLSARRSVGTALLFGEISLSELDTKSLRGYGGVDPGVGAEVGAVAADLRALMRRGIDLLREQGAGGLTEQVARLGGPVGTILRTILDVSTDRRLAEVRPLVAAAAERAEGTTFDVGVFGRVSSGKSSLLNALVGGGALPVGATPVTAVPVRIRRGEPAVEVRFRDRRTEGVPLDELPTYATEEHNPHNERDDGEETERARAYLQTELLPLLGTGRSVEVLPISTRPGHLEGLGQFRGEVIETTAASVADAWARGADGALAARMAIQTAAARALTSVRAAVQAARAVTGAESGPETRRVPPLFNPELLDGVRELAPPRFLPAFLRHLDQALHRFAARLHAWGAGALEEIQPPAEAAPFRAVRNAELAALEPLLDNLPEPARSDASVHAH